MKKFRQYNNGRKNSILSEITKQSLEENLFLEN